MRAQAGFLLPLSFLGLSLSFTAGCTTSQSTTDSGKDKGPSSESSAAKDPEFRTTSEALVKEVIADEKAATTKYQGKVVELQGRVDSANQVVSDKGFFLTGAKKKPSDVVTINVLCIPAAAVKDKVWWLGKGQKVKVIGQVTGMGPLAVSLDRCTLKELERSPTVQVSAKDLTAAFAKDEAGAKKKYLTPEGYPKEIIVIGMVADRTKTKDDFYKIILAGSDGLTVGCTVKPSAWEGVNKGDKVTIKGDLSGYYPNEKNVNVNTAFVLKKG